MDGALLLAFSYPTAFSVYVRVIRSPSGWRVESEEVEEEEEEKLMMA